MLPSQALGFVGAKPRTRNLARSRRSGLTPLSCSHMNGDDAAMPAKPESIDAYLAQVPADRRAALQNLRKTILSILPAAVECISYSMPAFRFEGRVVAGFQATASGGSYYPFSGTTLSTLAADLRAYSQTKSALHFSTDAPLPKPLVRRLLEARLAEGRLASSAKRPAATRSAAQPAAPRARKATKKKPAAARAKKASRATKRTRPAKAASAARRSRSKAVRSA